MAEFPKIPITDAVYKIVNRETRISDNVYLKKYNSKYHLQCKTQNIDILFDEREVCAEAEALAALSEDMSAAEIAFALGSILGQFTMINDLRDFTVERSK